MKVILSQDVPGLGGMGDLVDVAQGYANNFLIPREMAVLATPGNVKHWNEKRNWIVKKEAADRAEAEEVAAKLEGATLSITSKSGAEGRLYGSVTVKDIAEKIADDLKMEVDRKKIILTEPIKTAGQHEATVRVFKDVEAKVIVDVIADIEPGEEVPLEEPGAEETERSSEFASAADEPVVDQETAGDAQEQSPAEEEAPDGAEGQPDTK